MVQKWLNLNSNTFLFVKDVDALLYDSFTKKSFRFVCEGLIGMICRELTQCDNLYSVRLNGVELDDITQAWINTIIEYRFAKLLFVDEKPVSIPPRIILGEDCDKGSLSYIHKLVINMGGKCQNDYCRQFLYPASGLNEISISMLDTFVSSMDGYNLHKICFVGDELLNDDELMHYICNLDTLVSVDIVVTASCFNNDNYEIIRDRANVKVVYDNVSQFVDICEVFCFCKQVCNVIIINDVCDFDTLENLNNDVFELELKPYYNGSNMNLFEKYVYMDNSDFENIALDKIDVFRNQIINLNFFGQLYVMPDGCVYTNPNFSSIGRIDDSIYDLLNESMDSTGSAWKYTRKGKPCSNCVYQWICPPPSNYELVMNKLNLCYMEEL